MMAGREEGLRRQLRHARRAHHELLLAADVAGTVAIPELAEELAAAVLAVGVVVQMADEALAKLREC